MMIYDSNVSGKFIDFLCAIEKQEPEIKFRIKGYSVFCCYKNIDFKLYYKDGINISFKDTAETDKEILNELITKLSKYIRNINA